MRIIATAFAFTLLLVGCSQKQRVAPVSEVAEPRFLELSGSEGDWKAVSISPFDGTRDTLVIVSPLDRIVVMSTSHYGFLDAIGRTDAVVGVSGLDYLYFTAEALICEDTLPPEKQMPVDIGYDAAPDYEKLISLKPDLVLTYSVSAAESPFMAKMKQLGIRVFVVNEHLESHPLARAAYIRLFGALTGNMATADSVYSEVRSRYTAITDSLSASGTSRRKVLMNIPYNDQWFVPTEESYLTTFIRDAGGEILGSESGSTVSTCISVEKAYSLSKDADCWLNVGWCMTMDQLLSVNPIFGDMVGNIRLNAAKLGLDDVPVVWNDNNRLNDKGGNDIWQSGVARPDLVLQDLAAILHPSSATTLTYYRPIK